jgi:hypothetical protein
LSVFITSDINKACSSSANIEDAIVGVPATRIVRENFGRDVKLDLSSPELEFENDMFPLNHVFDHTDWYFKWRGHWNARMPDRLETEQKFFKGVVETIQRYKMPIIRLDRKNSREAICLVFEKVNVGGKKLDAFELVTAIYAAYHHRLAKDAGVCVSTVKTALRKLRSAGFITWTNTTTDAGDAGSNIYHITLEGRAGDAAPRAGDGQRRTAPVPQVGQDVPEGRAGAGHKASREAPGETFLALDGANSAPPTKKREITNTDQAEAIYQAYPRHEAKKPALNAIRKAMRTHAADFLLERVQAYAAAIKPWKESNFIPLAMTWFNQERYNDDSENWKQPSDTRTAKPRPKETADCFGIS